MGFWMTTLLGIGGSLVGGIVGGMLWKASDGRFHRAGWIMSILGAMALIWLYLNVGAWRASPRDGQPAARSSRAASPPRSPRCSGVRRRRARSRAFKSVPLSRDDTLVVPEGYRADVLFAWGDPVGSERARRVPLRRVEHAQEQALQAGMHHDGMQYFPLPYGSANSSRGLLAINHEYLSERPPVHRRPRNWNAAKVAKAIAARASRSSRSRRRRAAGAWCGRRDTRGASPPTRRARSAARRGSDLMKTARDPRPRSARHVRGVRARMDAVGHVPHVRRELPGPLRHRGRADRPHEARPDPVEVVARWESRRRALRSAKHPNESQRVGWVVEIDPYEPAAKPVKRTALGRCCHESATPSLAPDGRLAIYTGDDKAFEYIYKYVSRDRVDTTNRAANASLLDNGVLHVAGSTPTAAANGCRSCTASADSRPSAAFATRPKCS
jgi:secreted PhoX family phosphatase/uncharacterized membrane protein YeaQ/YmgE (transglycosylase-associated protein family)